MEMLGQQLVNQFLRAPLLTRYTREEVSVSNIGLIGGVIQSLIEDHLQFVDKRLVATHQLDESLYIVGHEEGVVPGTSLMETGARLEVLTLTRVKGGEETAVGQQRAQGTTLLAVILSVTQRTATEEPGIGFKLLLSSLIPFASSLTAQLSSQQREGIISHIILQGMRNRVVVLLTQGHVAQLHIVIVIWA